jgi:hypothetical protein
MTAEVSVRMPPAPTPWKARKAASMSIEPANAHSTDPARNTPIAARNSRLRPWVSDSLPNTGTEIVEVIRNAVVTHAWAVSPFRLSPIRYIAAATTV